LGKQNHRNSCGDLYCLVDGHAKGTVLVDLAVAVGMGDMKNAGEQDKRNTENS
jgi:hypothetical protein